MVRRTEIKKIHIAELDTLILESTAISMTAALLCELNKKKVKVIFCDEKRNPCSELISYYGSHDSSAKIRNQISWNKETKDLVWTEIVKEKIQKHIIFLDKLRELSEYSLLMDCDLDIISLLKMYNLKINTVSDDFVDIFLDYIRIVTKICKISVIVVLNIKQFFERAELEEIYKICFYEKITLINIEGQQSVPLFGDKYYIIDKDLCIIET